LSKLPKKDVAELLKQRVQLQKQLTGLEKVPFKETLAKMVAGLKVKGQEKLTADLWNLANTVSVNEAAYVEKLGKILGVKTSQPAKLMKMVESYAKASTTERGKIIDQLWQLGDKAMGQEVSGLKPLMKRIQTMQRRFPGKAKKAKELTDKITKVSESLRDHYHLGGEEYFPRLYLSKEERLAKGFPLFAERRVRAQFAKQRKKIPEDVRKAMGEIKEPAFPVVKRMIQESSAIETGKLFEFAANNSKWASSEWIPGFVKKALPDTKAYGALRGMFVHPTIHSDVTALLRTKSDIEALYDAAIGTWKLGKTIWNPAVHFRNMFSNSVLLDLSGMDHIQQAKYMGKALKHIKANSKEYQEARRYFMRTTMVHGELLDDMLKGFK
ncbi:hypothetical protein LCGC14_2919490, partial [marine sediment metagenome]